MKSLSTESFIHDRETWDAYIALYGLDVYYEYDYMQIECGPEDTVEMFVYSTGPGMLLYPYLKRSIPDSDYFDIATPYGYGGPVFLGLWSQEEVLEVRDLFVAACKEANIITETIRFHPLLENAEQASAWVDVCRPVQPTTAVNLRRPLDHILAEIGKMTKRNIKKAERDGVTIRKAGFEELDTFIALYWETMDKRHAEERYYFDRSYFTPFFLSDRIDAEFLFAEREGEVIGACFVLYSPKYAHYHLGASSRANLAYRPNHLLFREMILEAHRRGKDFLHYGGGATASPDDSLLLFKKSFTGNQESTFYLGQSIIDPAGYEQICLEFAHRYSGTEASTWFPLYRTPISRLSRKEEESL